MNVVNFGSLNIDHVYAVDHFCRAGETIHTKSYTQNRSHNLPPMTSIAYSDNEKGTFFRMSP